MLIGRTQQLALSPFRQYTAQVLGGVYRLQGRRIAEWLLRDAAADPLVPRRLFGGTAMLNVGRTAVQRQILLHGDRFVPERHLVRGLLRPGMRVVDVGANIGYYALLIEQSIGATGRLWCFEPEPSNQRELEATIARNGWRNVTLVRAAVGDRSGTVHFATGINGSIADSGSVEVPLVSLDAMVDDADFIKIDVEGYELHVLHGAQSLLRRARPALFVEVHPFPGFLPGPDSVDAIVDFLRSLGRRVEFYECTMQSVFGTIATQYLSRDSVQPILDVPALLNACRQWARGSTFWIVCR